jgi:hypothetical protein
MQLWGGVGRGQVRQRQAGGQGGWRLDVPGRGLSAAVLRHRQLPVPVRPVFAGAAAVTDVASLVPDARQHSG